MKLYRVVPVGLNPGPGTAGYYDGSLGSYESLYYELGYVAFNGRFKLGYGNNIVDRIEEVGKYCYFFIEDAMSYLYSNEIQGGNIKLLEFDVPDEIAFKLAGYGEYGNGDFIYPVIDYRSETFISKSDFGGEKITGNQVSTEDKRKLVLSELRKIYASLELLNKKEEKVFNPQLYHFNNIKCIDEATDEILLESYKHYTPFARFFTNNHELIKTDFITLNSCMLVFQFDMRGMTRETNFELLINNGFKLDYSSAGREFRDNFTSLLEVGKIEEAKNFLRSRK